MTEPAHNPRRRAVRIETDESRDYLGTTGQRITLVPLKIVRRQHRKLLIAPTPELRAENEGLDTPMIKTLGKAFYWQRLLDAGEFATIKELAAAFKLDPGWTSEVLRMTLLAPDIVAAILQGRQPRHLNLHTLRGRLGLMPRDWTAQRKFLNIPAP